MLPEIAILSPLARDAGPTHGGITAVIVALSNALCELGVRVELLTLSSIDPHSQVPQLHRAISVHKLGPGRRRQQAHRLGRYLAERTPATLLAAGHRANVLAARQAGRQTRVVLSVHNAISPGLARVNPMRRWLRKRALHRDYRKADSIICVSDGVAADLERLAPSTSGHIHVRYNPIAAPDADPHGPVHQWLHDPSQPVILGAGRLTTQKGFDTLIHALAQLRHQPSPRLVILGEGSEGDSLRELAVQLGVSERLALPGFVSNPRAHMAAASVFVLSSAWEGFGNVLVEAMAAGTPVVATDCPSGPREILLDGALGPLVPVGDSGAMADAIGRMLAAPTPADRLRQRATDFSPTHVAARYLELLLPGRGV